MKTNGMSSNPRVTPTLVEVFRSHKREGAYLYLTRGKGFAHLPPQLQAWFRPTDLALTLWLKPGKTLAQVDADKVLRVIGEQGYYLQMPPPREPYLLDLYRESQAGS